MNRTELIQLLKSREFRPSKKLGQNFLIDDNFLDFIVRTANVQPDETVLEVGPGFGVLTEKLLDAGANVVAIEFDHRLCDFLRNRFVDKMNNGLTLLEGDACRIDLSDQPWKRNGDFRVVANLPYAISSPLISRLSSLEKPPRSMVLTLQKETAERLVAKPGTKAYGALSVRVQAIFASAIVRSASRRIFHPIPEVDSAVARFDRLETLPDPEQRKRLDTIVNLTFAQRRKKMLGRLATAFDRSRCEAAFATLGLDEGIRPDRVDPETFLALVAALS